MKKIATFLLCSLALSLSAQPPQPRTIKVVGTAEMDIIPDEIYMQVELREYTSTKDKKKYTIEELEERFLNYLNKVVLVENKEVKYDDMSAYISFMRRKNKDEVITKTYSVKVKNSKQVYLVYSAMDSLAVRNAHIKKYSHSKMDEYKKQIKIDAIKAAQNKAEYLMAAIGSKAGKPVSVVEKSGYVTIDEDKRPYRGNLYSNTYSQSVSSNYDGDDDKGVIVSKTIKLRYEIDAEFEIQ